MAVAPNNFCYNKVGLLDQRIIPVQKVHSREAQGHHGRGPVQAMRAMLGLPDMLRVNPKDLSGTPRWVGVDKKGVRLGSQSILKCRFTMELGLIYFRIRKNKLD